jgi:hypothetical protein
MGTLFSLTTEESPEPYEGDIPQTASPFQQRAVSEGAEFDAIAFAFIEAAGGTIEREVGEIEGIPIDGIVMGKNGRRFLLAAHGTIDDGPKAGLNRVDTVHKVGHRASLIPADAPPLLVLTSHLPVAGSKAAFYLALSADHIFDVVATAGDLKGFIRIKHYLNDEPVPREPQPAPWRAVVRQEELTDA